MKPLLELGGFGQSYWLDNLSRPMIDSGELARRVAEQGLRGVTANPSIFEKAIVGADAYDDQIRELALAGRSAAEIYEALVTTDVQRACDVLRGVFDASGGRDGFVSLEVSPHLARHAAASVDEAHRLTALVERPNLMIKIPGTQEGLVAIEQLLFDGVNVNVTLLFSVPRYEAVAETHMAALERRLQAGKSVDSVASVASFFLSRIDVLVDRLLAHRQLGDAAPAYGIDPATLRGRIAVASARLAYRCLLRRLESPRWRRLESEGAQVQRLLWASTGTKDPHDEPLKYVEPLIGPHTVSTMPEKTAAAFAESGRPHSTACTEAKLATRALRDLRQAGIDLRRVTAQLEDEGIDKFIEPYDRLLRSIETRRRQSDRAHADVLADELANVALALRCDVIEMTTAAGSGHPSSCLSAAEIVAALFFRVMRWDPTRPQARDVDTFVLSKGHAAPLLWAALSRAGAIEEDINRLRRIDSTLEGHPTPRNAWVRVATGSLGQGLAAANGMAIANRLDRIDARIYCLLGDGECSEGSVWEAAQFAALHQLANLVAIVDLNGYGQSGPTPWGHDCGALARRFGAFGWKTFEVDGHDLSHLLAVLEMAAKEGPSAIIARTVKGQGVSLLAGRDGWHGKALTDAQRRDALAELGAPAPVAPVRPRTIGGGEIDSMRRDAAIAVSYRRGDLVATREAFGNALCKLGEIDRRIVVVDADVMDSTRTAEFARAFPGRFAQCHVAEQNMVGVALGLAAMGKVPVVATFACFLTRAADFIRMAGHSRPQCLVFCGSHAGVSIGEDGPSQMGLEDLALFRAMNGSTILYPSDAVAAERLTELATRAQGIVYLRTGRPTTPVIYGNEERFEIGGSKVLRASEEDVATVVAAGITVHEALAAHRSLARQGIRLRVIDAYSVKPLDASTLRQAAADTGRLLVVEDHWIDGGLGDAVAAALAGAAEVQRLAIREAPRSGPREALLDRYGISRQAIEQAVEERISA